jgi:hypothetical protein
LEKNQKSLLVIETKKSIREIEKEKKLPEQWKEE